MREQIDTPDPKGHPAPSAAAGLADVSVIVPAFNEEQGIRATLSELRRACPAAEVVVVNDGSTDGTCLEASRVEGVRIISHARNRGYGAAVKTGIRHASRRCVAWYDADGQHRPEDLVSVADPVVAGTEDLVIGKRGPDSAKQRDRAVGKVFLNLFARILSGERIPDLNSGLRCFRKDVISRYLHLLPEGFSASTTSTILMIKRGYRVGYVPIVARKRVGHSTVKFLSDGLTTAQLIVRMVVLFEAFRVFSAMGLFMLVTALVYGVTRALVDGRGLPTLAGTTIVAGVLTIFMGLIADQVSELRKERFETHAEPSEDLGVMGSPRPQELDPTPPPSIADESAPSAAETNSLPNTERTSR